jgi:succinyl-CoA synthetase beta subunit
LARVDEGRGKEILAAAGIKIPRGGSARSPEAARELAAGLGAECVVKALALVTGRAARGWVRFAADAGEAAGHAAELLAEPEVQAVRVEERLAIEREFFAAMLIDDRAGCPVAVFSSCGGSGIEEIAREHQESVVRRQVSVVDGLQPWMGREMAASVGLSGKQQVDIGALLSQLYAAFRAGDCRSLEINPVAWTADGRLVAADCHAAIDDYAVYRHPELGIEMAREIGHDPNELELIAWQVEKHDYRGTFFFIQLADAREGDNFVAFHGAGGGGSMMSMDALMKEGFAPANFCDTSGNPPASKVYRAAKVLLSMPGIAGYFASGSGVASQEQWQSAHGLIKAFREVGLKVPAVIRLGGNQEELAIERLERFCTDLGVPLEAYGKDDSARFCTERLRTLVDEHGKPAQAAESAPPAKPTPISAPEMPEDAYSFETFSGCLWIDQSKWTEDTAQAVVDSCPRKILRVVAGPSPGQQPAGTNNGPGQGPAPTHVELAITAEEAKKGKCIECLACELKAFELGTHNIRIDLPMPGPAGYGGAQ